MKIVSISEEKKKYDTKDQIKDLMGQIEGKREELVGIDISENSFSPECILLIIQLLSTIKTLEVVIFKGIFTQRGKEDVEKSLGYIAEHLSKLEGLTYFDMSDNALSMHGIKMLCPLIEKMQSIRHLVLNNNGIGRDGGEYLAESLTNLSKKTNSLQSVELGRNRLEDSAESIGRSLKGFPYLDTVKIYQNSIGSVPLGEMLNLLSPLPIRVLDIADNFLLEHGSIVLAQCMKGWSLEALNAADCLMGDKGLEAMTRGIVGKSRIQGELLPQKEVDLSYNDITEVSMNAVKTLLSKVSGTTVIITGNEFAEENISELEKTARLTGNEIVFASEDEEELLFTSEEKEAAPAEEEEEKKIGDIIASISLQKQEKDIAPPA